MKYKDEEGASTLCQIDTFYTDVDGFHCLIRIAEPPGIFYDLTEFKPYLRPMSSMTDEEKREVGKLGVCNDGAFHNDIYDIGISMEEAFAAISWLLERHFDINYLIEKGLALEAKEGMYKID